MAKKQPKSRVPKSATKSSKSKQEPEKKPVDLSGWMPHRIFNRELVESIVIAFVLAFLFRTFQAEAFVIPTGSMANTLVGRHRDVDCPKCAQRYRAGASSEVDTDTGRVKNTIVETQCPNCGYVADVAPGNPQGQRYPSYSGDRILVGKFAYESGMGEPERWDVAVFKYPGRTTVNYIKRLVGLPNETLRISDGDIYVKPEGADDFTIARKSHSKVRAMMQPVHDNDNVPVDLYKAGWPTRWQSDPTGTKWIASDDYRVYKTDGPANEPGWLRYRHTLAGKRHWMQLEGNAFGELDPSEARSYLITDANAYNSSVAQLNELMPGEAENRDKNNMDLPLSGLGMNWVSDLILDCDLTVEDAKGQAAFELIDSGRQLRCTIDLTSGEATLSIGGLKDYEPKAQTKVKKAGTFAIGFANVDNKLYLWVDGRPVEFDSPTEYPSLGDRVPTEADLAPAAIGAAGGAELQVSHLKLHRDIYYIAMSRDDANRFDDVAMFETVDGALNRPDNRAEFFSNPEFWRDHAVDHARTIKNSDAFRNSRKREFPIGEDKYFMLGDNSARSADGRLWTVPDRGQDPDMGHTVDRKLMIGKALFIYWPHSFNEIPGLGIPFPMFPNFGDMKFVR